jgi:hypothetical protein
MSKLGRTLVVGDILAAVSLAGMTAVAHAQVATSPPGTTPGGPARQGQVGEAWHPHPVTSQHGEQDWAPSRSLRPGLDATVTPVAGSIKHWGGSL